MFKGNLSAQPNARFGDAQYRKNHAGQRHQRRPKNQAYLALVARHLNKTANEWLWIDKAPKITLYREPKRRIRWLTPAEAERLIAALPEYMADMATFSLATGLRQSNVYQSALATARLATRRSMG